MRVLIVEDEYKLAELIETRLKRENYSVDIALNGEDGAYNALTNIYDLIILDVMLPIKNGFEILKEMKENNIKSQVLMLTARTSLEDKLEGFSNGADDYLTKPFHMEELVARINAKLRNKTNDNSLIYEDLKLNTKNMILRCTRTNDEIEVIKKEFLILEYLMKNPNNITSKEFLYDNVWGFDNESMSNNLEAYISFIRKKLKSIGSKVNIKSNRGLGYKLEVSNENIQK